MNYRLTPGNGITPDQFLAQPSDPDDDAGEPEGPQAFSTDWATGRVWEVSQPHELLAPLERIANALEGQSSAAEEEDRLRENFTLMTEEIEDLHAKYESLFGLVADIEKLVSKSTSKLALSVKDAINGWKSGDGPEPTDPDETVAEYVVRTALEPVTEPASAIIQPAHDAPVEEWRAYAADFELAEGINLEQMNRSQIRSVLGIPQTAEPSDG